MNRTSVIIVACLALSGAAACATTKFSTSWKSPEAQPLRLAAGDKVVAMVISPNEATRRSAETALAAQLDRRGLQGVPAYTIIATADVKDEDKARAAVEQAGAVAVMAMRVTGREQELSGRSPEFYGRPYYRGFWGGYYGWGWGAAYSPGYLRTDTVVYVETLVYDVKQNALVWAGQSETMNPSTAESFVRELVDEAVAEMRKQGVVAAR